MVANSYAAALAGIGITPAGAQPMRAPHHEIDRELRLTISDAFARQTWVQSGRAWSETRDVLVMHECEIVRMIVFNDTLSVRVVSFGGHRTHLRIRPSEMQALDLFIDNLEPFVIAVFGQPPMSRPVKIREATRAE